MKHKTIFSLAIIFGLLLVSGTSIGQVHGSPLLAPVGTAFTYQGKLIDSGAPANGTYDFTFALYDALSGGVQVGSTMTRDDVAVTDGLFTVQLDFGAVFDGTALYLAIGVRPGSSSGAYTTLTPRQALTAAPYARYAEQVPWNGLIGIPPGFADGTDDGPNYTAGIGLNLDAANLFSILPSYRLPQACATGQVAKWDNGSSTWVCALDNSGVTYTDGTGLDLDAANQFSLLPTYRLPQACVAGQVAKWDDISSTWVCASDSGGAAYTAGEGLVLTGTTFSVNFGTGNTQVARGDHNHDTVYINVGESAGGDLTGTYPNPAIAANAVGSAEIADGSIDMADTRNWMGFNMGSAIFVGGSGNPDITIWGTAFTPSANGTCLVIANAFIISTGNANDDPQPALDTAVDRGGSITSDPYVDIPFSPQDVDGNEDIAASTSYVWSVNAGQATRFGCQVSDPDGDWDTDETIRCRISYICQ